MLSYCFDAGTKPSGWGTMDPEVWQDQIDTCMHSSASSPSATPKLDEVMTMDILKATQDSRPKMG